MGTYFKEVHIQTKDLHQRIRKTCATHWPDNSWFKHGSTHLDVAPLVEHTGYRSAIQTGEGNQMKETK